MLYLKGMLNSILLLKDFLTCYTCSYFSSIGKIIKTFRRLLILLKNAYLLFGILELEAKIRDVTNSDFTKENMLRRKKIKKNRFKI